MAPLSESLNSIYKKINQEKEIKHQVITSNNTIINQKTNQIPNIQNPQINIYYVGRKKYIIKSIPIEQNYDQQLQVQQQKFQQLNLQAQELPKVILNKFYF